MIKNLFIILTLFAPLILSAQNDTENSKGFIKEIDQKIPEILEDFYIPGAAVAIIENGEVVLQKCYGLADAEKGIKIAPSTGFNVGSISKMVTGWGVMKLVQEGKLDLDAPVENYLTKWHLPESKFNSDKVTVRRLLSHTAGLSISGVSKELSFDDMPTLVEWLNGDNDGLGPVEIFIEPGTKWEYSGGGYAVVQLIIEEITGQKFEDFMQTEVLDPLGMTNSGFKISDRLKASSATPYDGFGEETEFGMYTVQSAAGFHTTLNDFIRFMIASLPNHKDHRKINTVLPPEVVKQMHEPAPNTKIGGWKYGLGYQSVHMNDGRVFIGHSGSNSGWQASFRIEVETMKGFIVLTNGTSGDNLCDPMFCNLFRWTDAAPGENKCWRKPSVSNKIQEHIKESGVKDLGATYSTLKNDQTDELDFSEGQLNNLGYHYLAKEELDKAVAVFKLNVDAYPFAYNVYDSYGEALLANGDSAAAVKNYRYSVKLNPNNQNGINILKELGESTDDMHLKVPIEHLQLLAGEYISTFGTEKLIVYSVEGGSLVRDYGESSRKLIPMGNDEFVYLDRNIHVRFDTNDSKNIILHVSGEGEFKKVK